MLVSWVLLAAAIALEVGATLSLRASDGLSNWLWAGPVVLGYTGAFVLLAFVLKRGIPVGVAYGIWAAIGVVATAALASYFFKDPFTAPMVAGVVLIGAGVWLLERGADIGN